LRGRPGRSPDTRELVISGLPYLVVYSVDSADPRNVAVLRVLHGAMLWASRCSRKAGLENGPQTHSTASPSCRAISAQVKRDRAGAFLRPRILPVSSLPGRVPKKRKTGFPPAGACPPLPVLAVEQLHRRSDNSGSAFPWHWREARQVGDSWVF
jgi:hypothetical protein